MQVYHTGERNLFSYSQWSRALLFNPPIGHWNSDDRSTHRSCMAHPYPYRPVSHVETAQRWLLGVCISNWLCTIPPNPSPTLSAHQHTLWCSGACVCALSVRHVYVLKCTVSVSVCTARPYACAHDWLSFPVCFIHYLHICLFYPWTKIHSFTKSYLCRL